MTVSAIIEEKPAKLIHVARIFKDGAWKNLYLRKNANRHFFWYEETKENQEQGIETEISGETSEEAMRKGARHWRNDSFTTLMCGFRYTLPERDEHGINALYHQMVASYSSGNGIYFDEELGNNCFVQNASEDALNFWRKLKTK